jgi:tRNA A-37 threonylcarbamoyl transferase component Bud32
MAPPEPPRTTLDRYELVERIAVGGMAEVFRAKAFGAHGFEKLLAIKRILPDLARDPEFESRFIAEAKLAVALSHANIVQVLDFGRFGGTLYIAMELVDGPDLAALLRSLSERGQRVPVSAALHIAMEMAKGIDFAHRHGVVHRDVSPSNILLTRSGEVKIADFGIAQAAEAAPASSSVRRIMGKWRYMSPEQARGEKLDPRSDLFSLGAVLYELFTGKKLFPGDEIEDVVRNVRDMPIPPPSTVRSDLPEALDAVLARCLERDPGRRWGSAGELHRALLELSYARSLVVTAADVAELIADFVPVTRSVAGAGGSGSASAGSGGGSGGKTRGRPGGLDDLIRAELLAGGGGAVADDELTSEVPRVTAQAHSPPVSDSATQTTFVLRGVGPDGITHFVIEPPAEATPVRAQLSIERLPRAEAEPAPPAAPAPRTSRAGIVAVAAAAALAAAVGGVALLRRSSPPSAPSGALAPTSMAAAAAAAAAPGRLEVVTEPPGATVVIDGVEQAERTPTVVTLAASTGDRHDLVLRLAGFRSFHGDVTVRNGERLRYDRSLEAARASLRVVTTPPAAEVTLDGKPIGPSPLEVGDLLVDGAPHSLHLAKEGFRGLDVPLALEAGASLVVERSLEPEVRFGKINLQVDPWAYVYFEGKQVAEAPIAGLRLPVGKQKLRLVNPAIHAEKNVVVDVPAKGVGAASFTME